MMKLLMKAATGVQNVKDTGWKVIEMSPEALKWLVYTMAIKLKLSSNILLLDKHF